MQRAAEILALLVRQCHKLVANDNTLCQSRNRIKNCDRKSDINKVTGQRTRLGYFLKE